MSTILADATATEAFGAQLAQHITAPATIWLEGNLGAGKTTLVRGFLHHLGHYGAVKSPTFTIVEPYQCGSVMVYHFDLYRLADPEELEYMGIRDYLEQQAILLIEWPNKGGWVTPPATHHINLQYSSDGEQRIITSISVSA